MKLSIALSAASLSALLALTSALPVQAGPIENIQLPKYTDVEQVQYRPHRDREWHGYRGYQDRRPGYRRHSDGNWYPLAAFAAGALITGAIVNSNRGGNHVSWCESRYRSYRASDDSFQPNYGPRQRCVSP